MSPLWTKSFLHLCEGGRAGVGFGAPAWGLEVIYVGFIAAETYHPSSISVYSVAKLWFGQAEKSHCLFKNFTVTLIFILPLTDGHVIKGGGGSAYGQR